MRTECLRHQLKGESRLPEDACRYWSPVRRRRPAAGRPSRRDGAQRSESQSADHWLKTHRGRKSRGFLPTISRRARHFDGFGRTGPCTAWNHGGALQEHSRRRHCLIESETGSKIQSARIWSSNHRGNTAVPGRQRRPDVCNRVRHAGSCQHIHTVWRDFDHDFGLDPLRAHYLTKPAPSAIVFGALTTQEASDCGVRETDPKIDFSCLLRSIKMWVG